MGKKKKNSNELGKSLIKDRFSNVKNRRAHNDKLMIHTTDLNDGYDWGRLNLQSVTEESSFQEFLSTAELAGTEFQAEKLNIKFVNPVAGCDVTSRNLKEVEEKHLKLLKIPRRPPWNEKTTPEELALLERDSFLEWRHQLAMLQEEEGFLLTPYEKNLEFWRQLWRVIERSDIVIQILDARNPLMFRCEDLETYVKEVSSNKENVLLLNKADFLTETQRTTWAEYFNKENVKIIFFSATAETQDTIDEAVVNSLDEQLALNEEKALNSSKIYSREELIKFLKTYHEAPRVTENITTVGLVGYPNVGKSSTINTLLAAKRVSVSSTPGKTKHFQTLFLDHDLLLCDCPGLVMPSFVSTKAEMITSGILPIDQMRDHVPPVSHVASLIPRHVFEHVYGIILPKPSETEDEDRPPTSEELLNAYGCNRGFMTQNGQPDNPRASRYILKDFVNGKLLYCHAPPGLEQELFHTFVEKKEKSFENANPRYVRAIRSGKATTEDIDNIFFKKQAASIHAKGIQKVMQTSQITDGDAKAVVLNHSGAKPWKEENKHKNKNKREKLRRVYSHLDEH